MLGHEYILQKKLKNVGNKICVDWLTTVKGDYVNKLFDNTWNSSVLSELNTDYQI